MTEKERLEQIDRWANYVRTSKGKWRKFHSRFINAQYEIANSFYERLSKTKRGKEKIKEIIKYRGKINT